jgi:hypothetical protein
MKIGFKPIAGLYQRPLTQQDIPMNMEISFFAMPLLCTDMFLEKRDESNLPPIDRSLFPFGLKLKAERHFIPLFGPCNPLY